MKIFCLLILTLNIAFAQNSGRDLSEVQLTESSCGAIALSQMQMLKEASAKKAIFDKDIDAKIFLAADDLSKQSQKLTAQSPDTQVVAPFLKTFQTLKAKPFAKECVALFAPITKKCYQLYKTSSREEANNCAKTIDQKKIQGLLDKHFLKK